MCSAKPDETEPAGTSESAEADLGGQGSAGAEALTPSAASLLAGVDANALMDQLFDRLLHGSPQYTPVQIAEASNVDRDVSRRLWRAMGLADVPDDVVAFTEMDLDALERTKVLLGQGEIQMHLIVQLARVLGLATARIADSVVDFTLDRLVADSAGDGADSADGGEGGGGRVAVPRDGHQSRNVGAEQAKTDLPLVSLLLDQLDQLVVYLLHRHLVDATARRLSAAGDGATAAQLAVGFADLVGFTALSQEISDAEIVSLIERFEALTSNEVVGAGGRIIKMIGDEVMFSAPESAGPEIALRLAKTFTDPELPSIRVGLASGTVLSRSGDLFGPVVNLAARATAIANPGTVVVSASIRDKVVDDERYDLRRLRPRRLKGIGFVELNVLRRAKGHEPDHDSEGREAEPGHGDDHDGDRASKGRKSSKGHGSREP
ncbi:MAG: adenylate/guanylate cyclase domain-containing protein [Actinomycetota bacterium]|nr:adenylate/guanylate cyclase domain-containing protein [Actinomycetota bacterium]